MSDASVHNEMVDVHAPGVQARDISGGVHFHFPSGRARKSKHDGPVVVGRIPQRPAGFQPRSALYERLTTAGRVVVVHSLTGGHGIGKTQLAAAYARACIDRKWAAVAWINAETADAIVAGFAELADALDLREEGDSTATAAERARCRLETADRCLVVFDNAVDPDVVRPWLPAAGGAHIVITSTRRTFGDLATLVDVEVFADDESLAFLRDRTELDEDAGAREVAEEVGRLPLALAQSAAVIRRQRLTYATFLERLRTIPVETYLTRPPGDPYPRGAAQAILLSVESAGRDDPRAEHVLELLSLLSPDGVDRDLLYDPSSPAEVDELLGLLSDASLLAFGVDGTTLLVHRFVQRVVRDRARRRGSLLTTAADAVRLLRGATVARVPTTIKSETALRLCRQIDSVWAAVAPEALDGRWTPVEDLMRLRAWEVNVHLSAGLATKAIERGTAALDDCERLLGPDHAETWRARNNLAGAHSAAGEHNRAAAYLNRLLRHQADALGMAHPDCLVTRNNLAFMQLMAGPRERATRMLEDVLADREGSLGADHPDTLLSRHNLGYAYTVTGRPRKALPLLERTLRDRKRVLHSDHLAISETLETLAGTYDAVGRTAESVAMREELLTRSERIYSPGARAVLVVRDELADAYIRIERLDRAVRLLKRNVTEAERRHGADSPITRAARQSLHVAQHMPRARRS